MPGPSYLTKGVTIVGADGNSITVSETPERNGVLLAIQQGERGKRASVLLTEQQFDALCQARYSLEIEAASNETKEEK